MSIWDRKIKHAKVKTSHDLTEIMVMATQTPTVREQIVGGPVDTIVIDTIDEIAKILIQERLLETKKETLAMGDWGWLGDQLRGIVRGFRNLDLHVVFTCHLKSTEDSETGRTFFKPAIQGAMGDEIAGYVDLALLLKAQQMNKIRGGESQRVTVRLLQTVPDSNHPWVKDRSGKLPSEFEINFHDDFERINRLIFGMEPTEANAYDAAKFSPVITPEEVKIIEEVLEVKDETPVQSSEPDSEPEVSGPSDGPSVVGKAELALMTAKQKMAIDGPAECEECGATVTNMDQKDMSVVKYRMILCTQCFKNAVKAKKG